MSESSIALKRLKRRLERIEPRRETKGLGLIACGHSQVDASLGGGFACGRMHEFFAEEDEASSGAGFVAMLSRCVGAGRPLMWLRTESSERQGGRLHATGLCELGLDPAVLVFVLVPDEAALLHAAAEAARCGGLGALVIECWGQSRGLDLTASRRLMLAAEASSVTVLLLRIGGKPAPSAAETRWRVSPALSIALEADAPGAPMFDLELLRRRAGPPAGPWRVEWDRDRLCFRHPAVDERVAGSGYDRTDDDALSRPALPRAVLPLAARGTPAADASAPVRRTG